MWKINLETLENSEWFLVVFAGLGLLRICFVWGEVAWCLFPPRRRHLYNMIFYAVYAPKKSASRRLMD